MSKLPINERVSKLLNKIRIRINMLSNEETEISPDTLNLVKPNYAKALKKISQIKLEKQEIPDLSDKKRNKKIIKIGKIIRPGLSLINAGGGFMIRKGKAAKWA